MDLVNLKHSNVQGDFIIFTRRKTEFSRNVSKEIKVYYTDKLRAIIDKYSKATNPYLFGVLRASMTEEERQEAKNTWKRNINKALSVIGIKLGFHLNLACARHTFASILYNKGVPISDISELLGHSTITQTQVYLSSIAGEHVKKIVERLDDGDRKRNKKVRKGLKKLIEKTFVAPVHAKPEISEEQIREAIQKHVLNDI